MTGGERHDNKKSIGKHADLQHVMEMADMPILGRPPTINNQACCTLSSPEVNTQCFSTQQTFMV